MRRLGKERTLRLHPYKRMIQAGIHLSGGSDSPVTPIDPLIGIYSAVNHPIKGSSISILEALKLYTIEAAAFSFDEGRKGSISEGKVADLIILSDDILKLKKEDIRKLSVEVTIRKGEIVVNKLKL